jgi:hypothetical protein
MCEVIETIKTKNYVAEIINDEDCYNPRKDYSSLGTLIAFHSRYDLSDNDNWDKEELISYVEQDDVLALPVYMYKHSGIALSTSAFSCKWDSGQIGYIFVSYEDIIKEYGNLDIETATKVLEYEIKEYSLYLNGECYGYIIYAKDKYDTLLLDSQDHLESCFGFIGRDYVEEEAKYILKDLEQEEKQFFKGEK